MSKAIRLSGLCISLVIALTGCVTASGGKEFDRTVVQTFHEGQTTQADVVAKLGQPQIKTSGEDGPGTSTWTYAYGSSTSDPKNFIPLVGGYLGSKADASQQSLTLTFDSKGVLRHISQREERF